jgi:hypothetical protein
MDSNFTKEGHATLYANYLSTQARLQAFENVFFGWLKTNDQQAYELNRKLLDEFYHENLEKNLNAMPDGFEKDFVRRQMASWEK